MVETLSWMLPAKGWAREPKQIIKVFLDLTILGLVVVFLLALIPFGTDMVSIALFLGWYVIASLITRLCLVPFGGFILWVFAIFFWNPAIYDLIGLPLNWLFYFIEVLLGIAGIVMAILTSISTYEKVRGRFLGTEMRVAGKSSRKGEALPF